MLQSEQRSEASTIRRRLAPSLAFGLPAAWLMLIVLPPWQAPQPFPNAGIVFLAAIVLLGAIGIALLPSRWPAKILAVVAYVPVTFLTLAAATVMLSCAIHGARACP